MGCKNKLPRVMAVYAAAYTFTFYANLAQLVEHFIRNERVVGSNPIVGSHKNYRYH